MVVSSVFWLLNNLLGKGDNLIEGKEFLLNIIGLTVFDANLLGEVHSHGVEDIHEVVHVKDTLAMPIIDVADPLNFFNVLFLMKLNGLIQLLTYRGSSYDVNFRAP